MSVEDSWVWRGGALEALDLEALELDALALEALALEALDPEDPALEALELDEKRSGTAGSALSVMVEYRGAVLNEPHAAAKALQVLGETPLNLGARSHLKGRTMPRDFHLPQSFQPPFQPLAAPRKLAASIPLFFSSLFSLLLLFSLPAHSQSPRSSAASPEYAAQLLAAWNPEDAAKVLRELEAQRPNDPNVKWLWGRVAFEQGDYALAKSLYEEAAGEKRAQVSEFWKLADAAEKENRATAVEESAHFSIRYKVGKDAALIPYAIETLEAAYDALVADLGWEPPGKIRVEIYSSPKSLARVSSLSLEAIQTTGTIALAKYNRLMITSPRALARGYDWLDTLTHELVHLMVTRKSHNTVPIWLHEGIAKFLETRWRSPEPLPLSPSSALFLHRAAQKDELIGFEAMHPSIALLPTQEDAALAFAQVHSAIEFIYQRKGMEGIRTLLEAMRDGASDKQAVSKALGQTYSSFESQWRQSVKTRKPPKGAHPHLEKIVFRDERQEDSEEERKKAWEKGELGSLENDQARRHAHLGELLRARQRPVAAAIEYEKAVKIGGGTHPSLARKYALTLMQLEKMSQAEEALRTSLAVYSEDSTNNLLLGRLLVFTERSKEALPHLVIANRRDPFDPEIHRALLTAARATGNTGIEARERDVLSILSGKKRTWRAPEPGDDEHVVGWLRIEELMGARVFIDGVDTGLSSPVAEHPLRAGKHVVLLEHEDGERVEKTVEVVGGELVAF